MRKVIPRESPSFVKCLILPIFLSLLFNCTTLRMPPKVTQCFTNVEKQQADCVNSSGTDFQIKFSDKGTGKPKDHGFDKMVCIPGDQFIDAAAWLQELIVVLTKGKK